MTVLVQNRTKPYCYNAGYCPHQTNGKGKCNKPTLMSNCPYQHREAERTYRFTCSIHGDFWTSNDSTCPQCKAQAVKHSWHSRHSRENYEKAQTMNSMEREVK